MSENQSKDKKAYRPPDEEVLLNTIELSPIKKLLIRKQRYDDKWMIDLRYFIETKTYKGPTTKGISIPIGVLSQVVDTLKQAI